VYSCHSPATATYYTYDYFEMTWTERTDANPRTPR
jgi:hypothetical protein